MLRRDSWERSTCLALRSVWLTSSERKKSSFSPVVLKAQFSPGTSSFSSLLIINLSQVILTTQPVRTPWRRKALVGAKKMKWRGTSSERNTLLIEQSTLPGSCTTSSSASSTCQTSTSLPLVTTMERYTSGISARNKWRANKILLLPLKSQKKTAKRRRNRKKCKLRSSPISRTTPWTRRFSVTSRLPL